MNAETTVAQSIAGVSEQEIVVTAQRRAQRLEEIPMAVSVVSAETIDKSNITGIHDLGRVAAGVQVNFAGAFTQPAIRGVTTLTNGNGIENNVAIYVDGFYEPSPVAINMELANVASIEVLKGPQGTLYGRNATGGAILINTLAPSRSMTAKFNLSYASFEDKRVSAYVSGPLTNSIRVSVAGAYRDHKGFLKLVDPNAVGEFVGRANPVKQGSVRTKIEADLGENLTATLAYNYAYSNDTTGHVYTPYEYTPSFIPNPPRRAPDLGQVSYNVRPILKSVSHQPTLKLVFDMGIGTLTSYTGYTKREDRSQFDFDGTYNQIVSFTSAFDQKTFQQALDLSINAIDNLDLIVGGVYYYDDVQAVPKLGGSSNFGSTGALSSMTISGTTTESYSFYADATYSLTDSLSINFGGRYTHDDKNVNMLVVNGAGVVTLPFTFREATFSKFTPRASIRYELAPQTSIYASWSKGFRSGSFSLGAVASPDLLNPIRPENITAYEVGFKTARSNLRFDISAFYYDYTDINVSVTVPAAQCPPGQTCVPIPQFGNAPAAEIYGVDAQVSVSPFEGLNIQAGGAWLHARYTDFPNATGTGLNSVTGLNVSQAQDWSGQEMARAPKFSANLNVDYSFPLASGDMELAGNLTYTDSYVINNASLYGPLAGPALADKQRYRQEAFALINASATWTDPSGRMSVGVFGRNLTDKRYRATYNGSALGDYSGMSPPRSFGVRLGYQY
jgi:iron complex outermembrane recepter protein